ncbi:mycofactocin system FadH/OYE family oxidoreductase 1 [Pseudonocardia alaniniphila]|uniref:Mycofactocin system FadH/OYE family oxidoreductase 1 n=1 Tax=Pseudonocardia alaniniphila TaxID=75291 RepID=A0ABS9TLY6_9PSEU|nr:mycofactocin system FadH/OYE family oxidoreductase 1 [Pseudonocardia alaniniphila]MCH6169554.1 mycofactocin system FadH/OYE family oxidoreductase 1 [Pseudonocardia alaniniphila]
MSGASLVRPVVLRGRTAPSRVLFGPHETNLARDREISDRHVAYYARRAAGGTGVIVTEVASVHDSDWPYERAPRAADAVPGWAAVVDACRPHGALVLAGLGHAGGQGSSAYGQQALWGPSGVADAASREVPMEMEQPEIDELVSGFSAAAVLAAQAGLDGVEINAGQHSILRQFLSGLTNRRADGYGEDRTRLLREVLAAVRSGLDRDATDDRVLGLRLCADELAPWAGITPEQGVATALAVAGAIDYLVVVRGSGMSVFATRPDLHVPPGFNRSICGTVRSALGAAVPVVLQGSVVDPAFAQAALDEGIADLVEMTRSQIAEPDLVTHVRAGTPERIRPCTLSNQHSIVRDPRNPIVSDEAEPRAGHETEDPPGDSRTRTGRARRSVLVVGGGPGGMEAARVLALRGHRVRLMERADRLGGALLLTAAVGGRERMGVLVPWWERELIRLGVEVETGVEADVPELDAAERAGTGVLLATGSRPGPRPYMSDVPVLSAADFEAGVLAAGSAEAALDLPAGVVVVHDPIGDWTGVGVAEQVAAAGRRVAIVTRDAVAGVQLSRTGDLVPANTRLQRAGVVRELYSLLRGVHGGRAVLEHVWTGERREIDCAVVLDCGHRLPEDGLWAAHPDLPRVGDCIAPRTVYEAVLEARRAAAEFDAVA